jgi:hypothetical protein
MQPKDDPRDNQDSTKDQPPNREGSQVAKVGGIVAIA